VTEAGATAGVVEHLEAFWPDHAHEDFAWTAGPISTRLPGFRVRRIAPLEQSQPWIYASIGACEATEVERKEFYLVAPQESPWHVETLAMVANFHADPRYRLSPGHVLDIGRPWVEGSTCDHLLVSLPYLHGPRLEHCETPAGHVQVLWLVPITAAEARLARERGVDALEDLLEQHEVDVLVPSRPSIA
jgi:hypothetical protein